MACITSLPSLEESSTANVIHAFDRFSVHIQYLPLPITIEGDCHQERMIVERRTGIDNIQILGESSELDPKIYQDQEVWFLSLLLHEKRYDLPIMPQYFRMISTPNGSIYITIQRV